MIRSRKIGIHLCLAALLTVPITAVVYAHPEDEFCVPGKDSLDPALCAALAELDRAESSARETTLTPLPYATDLERSALSTALLYVGIGIDHILPDGLDHILFVLALFLTTVRLRPLIIQVSAFTVAHTATLALTASGVIAPPSAIVEPLIALTIAFVAFENLFFRDMTKWRPAVVFAFGLIHGLGFAGFFGDLGLPPGQFWSALVGFNLGVEIGQLSVLCIAVLLGLLLRRTINDTTGTRQYRRFVVLPGSVLIGLLGCWWAADRLFA